MSSIIISKATEADIEGIYALVEELAIYEKARHEMTMTLAKYHASFDRREFEAIVALSDNQVVGTCIYYDTFSTWKGKMLYLEDFVVKEAFRKYGIGQQLYNRLLNIAKEKDCALAKWQVLDWNEPAVNFYKKNNAIIEKEWWNCKVVF